jgi:hypothetical protein
MKFRRFERDVLEAIDRARELRPFEIPEESGWDADSCRAATGVLRKNGLIEKRMDIFLLTEAGKVTLAILKGQEARKRYVTRQRARDNDGSHRSIAS